jgi:hypothetical protein
MHAHQPERQEHESRCACELLQIYRHTNAVESCAVVIT